MIAFSYRGGRYCAGLLACTVISFSFASVATASTNVLGTTATPSRDEKSGLASLALQVVGQIQSQQQATLRAVEASQKQNAETTRSLVNRLRVVTVVGVLLAGGMLALLLYVRKLLRSIQHGVLPSPPPASAVHNTNGTAARLASLLAAGEALLNLKQPARAVVCFDEVLALDSCNAGAHVRKGAALEQLGRLDEALVCYDQAIALDVSLSDAYVGKGAVYNRLERYREALECYEKAARLQPAINISEIHSLH
ncbi:MAG TPA: tetratricopeptide repeat protein [Verrucomicrobiae bacterium]|nr:tetratricopeptide repeat protein [Verrucomicrobiae bacterium]